MQGITKLGWDKIPIQDTKKGGWDEITMQGITNRGWDKSTIRGIKQRGWDLSDTKENDVPKGRFYLCLSVLTDFYKVDRQGVWYTCVNF